MRITSISSVYNRSLLSKNVKFGKIEKENRDKILASIPEQDKELKKFYIRNLDENEGTIVKWGGKGHPRGLFYADLIPEYANKSPMSYLYNDTIVIESMDHLEKKENFRFFAGTIDDINYEEKLAKKGIKKTPNPDTRNWEAEEWEARTNNAIYGMFGRI